jgi:hypothetical protein
MTLHQLELGVLVVIEFHLGPFDKAMTGFTFFTQTPFVVIVTPVTVDAFSFQLFLEIVSLVTGVALHLIMGATKRELGFIVVELGFRPTYGVVAFVTFFPKSPLVNIVKRMTGETFRRCIFIALIRMTAVARHLSMFSHQPEFGLVMVKPPSAPRLLRMALGTGFPQPAKVGVVIFMALDAKGWCFPVFFAGSMAATALDGTMLALEGEIRVFVIERFQVQLNNICAPAFMVGVAMLALDPFYLGITAMKSFFLFEVNAHRLVACQALLILPTFFE